MSTGTSGSLGSGDVPETLAAQETYPAIMSSSFVLQIDMFVDDAFEKLEIGGLPDDAPAKLSGWLFEKCEDLPEVGFSFDYLAQYTMENQETGDYQDYAKMMTLAVAEVKDRRITVVKVTLRDATEEEIETAKTETSED